jgi:hypothetical protein
MMIMMMMMTMIMTTAIPLKVNKGYDAYASERMGK